MSRTKNLTPEVVNPAKTLESIRISVEEVLNDYKMAQISRYASLLCRKEVFLGRAKFGIFGDGKEVAQIAMAKVFRNGDFRSGYYRDQTFMFAAGMVPVDRRRRRRVFFEYEYPLAKQGFIQGLVYECLCPYGFAEGDS